MGCPADADLHVLDARAAQESEPDQLRASGRARPIRGIDQERPVPEDASVDGLPSAIVASEPVDRDLSAGAAVDAACKVYESAST